VAVIFFGKTPSFVFQVVFWPAALMAFQLGSCSYKVCEFPTS
jgi:hypothetical protein